MDTDEVIIEKVVTNTSTNNKCMEHTAVIENNSVDNFSSTYIENNESQVTDDCEVILIDNIEIQQSCHEKNSNNEQQRKLVEASSTDQSEIQLITNDNKNLSESDPSFAELKQKNNDVCIVHERIAATSGQKNDKISSLVSIAVEYGNSDSETEDSDQTKQENNLSEPLKEVHMQNYRQNVEASSSEESDSEEDSTSSSDSSALDETSDSNSDDTSKKKGKGCSAKGQKSNEMKSELDDLPPIEDLKISVPEVLCDPLGEVAWMVEQLVVVKPKSGKPTLNLDTVLFVERGQRALGKIFDVFGQVNEPHYCVRFNSSEHIKECDVKVGMTVYYCPNTEYTSLVFLHELMKIKGIDATADEPPEFSDDEEERAYYEKLKAKQVNNTNDTDIPAKRKRSSKPSSGWQSNHPWNRNAQRHRRGYHPRTDRQLYGENQSQNLWSQPYQNSNDQYGYGAYSLQYMNHNVNSVNQNFYSSQNYYDEDSTAASLNPRIPFNACPRIPSGYVPFQNPNTATNVRFQSPNVPWQPQMPQASMRPKMPWVPLPPPPPPPPPPSSSSPGTT